MPAESSYPLRTLTHILGNDTDGNVGRSAIVTINTDGTTTVSGPVILKDATTVSLRIEADLGNQSGGMTEYRGFGTSGIGSFHIYEYTRGADASTHTIVNSGDNLAWITFRGSDGAAFREAALIQVQVDGTPGSSDMPGRILIYTTRDGASGGSLAMTINSDQQTIFSPGSTTPATLGTNGQFTLTPTSNTNFRISYRGSDGSTRTGNITLS